MFVSTWVFIVIGLVWVVSLLLSYSTGLKKGFKIYAIEQQWVRPFLQRWVENNNKFVSDISYAALSDDAKAQQENVHLIADNRRLKKKVFRLAFKYGNAAKMIKEKDKMIKEKETYRAIDLMYYMVSRYSKIFG